ncbi:GNAT family N-acetyltransferase [Streptomyces venezuelae]|uniref:GNAT family N-acetyltransferase n=1 Tax=Streptomyces venezuelae TaxID=54571 RepID=A0A5P2D0W1_STRVZ|nr:GNAT family N-acetyltransferase [Streptomyces venezuelae]QES47678.1 GNAT family N-acetyltransferase [Streptomyces venezuelae]
MTWTFTRDLGAYLSAAGPAVAARPVVHTMLLTVADALERRGPHAFGAEDPFFGWWTGTDGVVSGALLCTPPHPVLLGAVPAEAVAALAGGALPGPVGGFNARRADAAVLAAGWGRPSRVEEELRLYRLEGLAPPDPAPAGRSRPAGEADLALALDWFAAFAAELGEPGPPPEAAVRDRISYGGLLVWEDGGGPVSMAGFSRPLAGTSRIFPVYTPPELRGRGYAAGATAAASRAARAAGAAEVLLFTDLANPTSNGIYLRLGYRPVEDRVVLTPAG